MNVLRNKSVIASMDWKVAFLPISWRCHNDLRNKITETVLKCLKIVMIQLKLRMIISTSSTTTCASECIREVENAEVRKPNYGTEDGSEEQSCLLVSSALLTHDCASEHKIRSNIR